jgi:hypothetical protein
MSKSMSFYLKTGILFGFLLLISSCKKDPCESTVCFNGGVCNEGFCDCPTGYSGPQCEDFDPCANVTCLNGGTCANGLCNCPEGYSGSDCGVELIPTSVTIINILLNEYPMTTPSGGGWDALAGNGPDVFVTLGPGTTSNLDHHVSGVYNNVTGQSLEFSNGLPVILTAPNSNYNIGVWDEDTLEYQFMGGVFFAPNNYSSGFPPAITLEVNGFSFTLAVIWGFD